MKVEDIKLAFETNVKLGLVQDITADLNSVGTSLTSIRPVLTKAEDVLIKNFQTLELAEKAIVRVEGLAKELGADSLLKELEKPKMLLKEFRNTTNNTLKAVQSGIANL